MIQHYFIRFSDIDSSGTIEFDEYVRVLGKYLSRAVPEIDGFFVKEPIACTQKMKFYGINRRVFNTSINRPQILLRVLRRGRIRVKIYHFEVHSNFTLVRSIDEREFVLLCK